jgi:hypothetical protein
MVNNYIKIIKMVEIGIVMTGGRIGDSDCNNVG